MLVLLWFTLKSAFGPIPQPGQKLGRNTRSVLRGRQTRLRTPYMDGWIVRDLTTSQHRCWLERNGDVHGTYSTQRSQRLHKRWSDEILDWHSRHQSLLPRDRDLIPYEVKEFCDSQTHTQLHAWLLQHRKTWGQSIRLQERHNTPKMLPITDFFPPIRSESPEPRPSSVHEHIPTGVTRGNRYIQTSLKTMFGSRSPDVDSSTSQW
jgi:hypothetical protein